MSIPEYLETMQEIQTSLLEFFDDEAKNDELNFFNLQNLIKDKKIQEEANKFKSFLYLVVSIANDFHRTDYLFIRVDKILKYFENDIKKYFSNSEIFNIFKSNKRILLFLVEEKIMKFDKYIIQQITKGKYLISNYPEYFTPEIKPFVNEEWFQKYEEILKEKFWIKKLNRKLPENFNSLRKKGENDSYICEMIRKDSIDDFITYINDNRNSYPISSKINQSIYETNSYLVTKKSIQLIEYSLFFGSIQIFNYLRMNGVELTPSLWIYAIHGKNPEIIHILEENEVEPEYKSHKKYIKEVNKLYKDCLIESIKCYHNDFTEYIRDKLQSVGEELKNIIKYAKGKCQTNDDELKYIIKSYNFILMKNEYINESSFYYLCKHDHYSLVNILIKIMDFDINKRIVYITNC